MLFVIPLVSFLACLHGITFEECDRHWSCSWNRKILSDLTKGQCFLQPAIKTTSPSPLTSSGLASLDVYCRSHSNSAGRTKFPGNIFECILLLAGERKVTQLLIFGCDLLEIGENDLNTFHSLEVLDISHTSIASIHENAFYFMDNLMKISIDQKFAQNGISEYPNALIGAAASNKTSSIKIGRNNSNAFLHKLSDLTVKNVPFYSGIPQHAFQNLKDLSLLELRGNNLSNMDFQSMVHLTNLSHLYISDSLAIDSLPTDLFPFLPNLITFELSGTSIKTVCKNDFKYLTNLHLLSLSNNLLFSIDSGAFSDMKYLTALNLDNNPSLGTTQSLSFLEGLDRLEHLYLGNCSLQNTSTGEFLYIPDLRTLSLRTNQLVTIPILFANLPKEPVCLTDIEEIDLSRNKIFAVPRYIFSHLPKLRRIDLSFNRLGIIPSRMFFNLDAIEEIFLNHNQIHIFKFGSLQYIDTLRHLDLRENNLSNFPQFTAVNSQLGSNGFPKNPFHTYLEGNIMFCECEMFFYLFEYKDGQWEREAESMYTWPGSPFLDNQIFDRSRLYCYTLFMGIRLIDDVLQSPQNFYSLLDVKKNCPETCYCYESCGFVLFIANCAFSNYTRIPPDIRRETTVIDIQNNSITALDSEFFSVVPFLERIDLSFNRIMRIDGGTFYHLDKLLVVHLNNNYLRKIDSGDFNISSSVFYRLDLSNNFISWIHNNSFEMASCLEHLDLSNNKLEGIPNGVFDNLPYLSYLSIRGNPLNCSCDLVYFTDWYMKINFERGKYLEIDIADIECWQFSNETEMNTWIQQQNENCYTPPTANTVTKFIHVTQVVPGQFREQWKPLLASLLGVIFLAILMCGLIYKYRLEIVVFIYIKTGWKCFGTRKDDVGKEYDAFISFSSLDRDFVISELVPKLEGDVHSRKLCIHHRDFVVGACIATNIVHAIANSKRIVILCSNNYLKSEWCSYEFKTSHRQALRDRRRRILLIMMEDVDEKYLDKEMKAYISTNTYLDRKDSLFWPKLMYAIPFKNFKYKTGRNVAHENDKKINMSELSANY
ncbi:Toll-like receptor Tollo [Holothuria leucospilota]|uniref:Toll-like receptor Tollo n=1 Tax=Holothuria leucospilota TaxID=206669 RepID=A0A9Q1BV60_HOLLE|nr:Toll-like receptor Tollo [Holothuria leucospilota]